MCLNPDITARFSYAFDDFQTSSAIAIEKGNHVLVTSHTGSGKSTVAEYAIAKAFLDNKRVFYTSPIKTLSNQKFSEFKKKFGETHIGIQTGDVKVNPDGQCLIMTTEILRNMLFRSDSPLDDLAFVVFDEVHYINDQDRGQVWEECIVKLPPHVQMVMLSATMANPEEFAGWIRSIKPDRDVEIYSTLKRPVPLYFSMFVPNPSTFDENSPWQEAITEGHLMPILDGDRGSFQTANYTSMVRRYEHFIAHRFDESKHGLSKQQQQQEPRKKQDFNMLSLLNKFLNFMHINQQVPAILFTLSRKKCDMYAERVEVNMVNHEERREIENIFEFYIRRLPSHEHYEQVTNMKRWLMKGVAVHHSGLIPILKEIVEIIFSKGLIKVLFATETFAIGINMPTKTVVFLDVTKNNGTITRPLMVEEFKQMAGRAGRRGLDTLGHVIYFPITHPLIAHDMQNMMQGPIHKITSKFQATTHYVLRGICSRHSDSMSSIFDITHNTLMHTEYMQHQKGYMQQLEEAKAEKQALEDKLDSLDPSKQMRNVYEMVRQLQAKMHLAPPKNKKNLQRQIEDCTAGLSKQEQRCFDQIALCNHRMDDLCRDIAMYEADIERAPSLLHEDIDKCVAMLTKYGYLTNVDVSKDLQVTNVTPKGIFANELSQCHEITLTEIMFHPSMEQYRQDPHSLACVLSIFLDDREDTEDQSLHDLLGSSLGSFVQQKIQYAEDIQEELVQNGIPCGFAISTKFTGPVRDWCEGIHFEQICKDYQIFEGNMIRALQRLSNLLDEMKKGYEAVQKLEWAQSVEHVKELITRDILVTDSIYLTY